MTANGGAIHDRASQDSLGLVVAVATSKPHPVDVPAGVHRMRAATLDAQWHAYLGDVFASCFASVES